MAIVREQFKVAQGGGTSINVTFDNNIAAGSLLLCIVSAYQPTTQGVSITDNNSNTWTEIYDTNYDGTDVGALAYVQNGNSGSTQVTVTGGASGDFWTVVVVEVSGIATTGALTHNNESDASGNTWDSGDITTTDPDTYCIGGFAHDSGNHTLTITSSGWGLIFEEENGIADMPISVGEKILSSTGTESFEGSIGSSVQHWAAIASFKADATGPTEVDFSLDLEADMSFDGDSSAEGDFSLDVDNDMTFEGDVTALGDVSVDAQFDETFISGIGVGFNLAADIDMTFEGDSVTEGDLSLDIQLDDLYSGQADVVDGITLAVEHDLIPTHDVFSPEDFALDIQFDDVKAGAGATDGDMSLGIDAGQVFDDLAATDGDFLLDPQFDISPDGVVAVSTDFTIESIFDVVQSAIANSGVDFDLGMAVSTTESELAATTGLLNLLKDLGVVFDVSTEDAINVNLALNTVLDLSLLGHCSGVKRFRIVHSHRQRVFRKRRAERGFCNGYRVQCVI